jgi:hypothetical protein
MNREELERNAQLSSHVVQDLNRNPELPFCDGEFETVREASGVTRPGGRVVMIDSDRWFPGKEMGLFSGQHPFEQRVLLPDCSRRAG